LDPDISTRNALAHLHVDDVGDDRLALDRRRFLQMVGMGLGAGLVAGPGTSLLDAALGHDASAWAAGPVADNEGIVVVFGMYGGNDGLNTVVPVTDGNYYDQHGALALSENEVLPLDDRTGLHPELTEVKRFWDAGQAAIVEGIGYPDPDLSHFNSMAIWMSAIRNGIPTTGWLGRWLDGYLGSTGSLYAGAAIGHSLPLHFIGNQHRGTSIPAGRPSFGAGDDERNQRIYQTMRSICADGTGWQRAVGQAHIDQLDLAARLQPIIPEELPEERLAAEAEVMARLINANLGFRVLSVGWGDFDSHAGQPSQHPVRMLEFNDALRRFFEVLDDRWAGQVTIMSFSEFGRTSWGNDGLGSDHGTAAPHIVLGARVKGGFYGQRPSLVGLRRWDRMEHHVDFRDYYGSIIDGWLGGGGSDVVGKPIDDLGLFRAAPAPGGTLPPPVPGGGGAGGSAAVGDFVSIPPARICDTRDGHGVRRGPLGKEGTISVKVAGVGGVPSSGVLAVALNVTSVNATSNTNFRVYPSGSGVPDASSLNPRPGRAVPNMVIVGVGKNGHVDVYNHAGNVDCVIDVVGYVGSASATRFSGLTPHRVLDTRNGTGAARRRVRGGQTIDVPVAGLGGVPEAGVDLVVLNVTSVAPTARGYVTAWATGSTRPEISNLNYSPGMNIPNLVMCRVGEGGRFSLFANSGDLDLVADVVGYFSSTGARHVAVGPARVLDVREGLGARKGRVGPKEEIELAVGGRGGVPTTARAAILNVTAAGATANSFVTVYPQGAERPEASSVNVAAGQTAANLVVAKLGSGGRVRLYNHAGAIDLIADVTGYFL
ncbi:MAG: DUF1501 domain-containing protein, partial [Actinomycetota bacterium]